MEQYISKSALVAEINKRIIDAPVNNIGHQRVWAYNDVKDIIATIEVKGVDLEKEWKKFLKDGDVGFKEIAKHFFELGLRLQTEKNITFKYNIGESVREYKAQKGE